MTKADETALCGHCGQSGQVRVVAERLLRCEACRFLYPRARANNGRVVGGSVARLSAVAPGGLLRGKYRLLQRLGEGAHGVSYLAEHVFLSHPCVVKVLPHMVGEATDGAVVRLRREARAGFCVQDPHVVRVLDCDVVKGVWYFVMEYVDGADLTVLLGAGQTVDWRQVVQIGADAARGLCAIHRAGLLHRDIKPGNLILGTDGRVRVADLGVASLSHEHNEMGELAGAAMVGTLAYTAPEMFRPDVSVGHRADLYSLGATLFHLATGRLPHLGGGVFRRLIDTQCQPVAWPAEGADDVPVWLVQVILRLLAIEPEARIDTPRMLIEELESADAVAPLRRAPLQLDALQPRGMGVLPLRNELETEDDDWLGYAVANYLSRALAEIPDVYVADQDGLVAMVERIETEGRNGRSAEERLLEAGRMVGAGTVVVGRFRRAGSSVRIEAEALRGGQGGPAGVAQVEGALVDLAELERRLFVRLSAVLGLGRRVGVDLQRAAPTPGLAAQQKFVLGKQEYLRGEYEKAIALAREAVALDNEFAEAIGFMGVCQARLGRYDEAEAQHRRQEELAKRWGDARRQIEALANLGVMNYFRGDYEAAELHYVEAARLADELDLAAESAQIRNNLGFVLFRRGRPADAEQAFLRAIETHRAYGGLTSLIGPYNGIGNVLVEQQRYEEARTHYQRALALAAEIGDRTNVGTTRMHLGRCAAMEGRFAEAKHEFTMALNVLEETRFWNGLARAYEYIAEMNVQLGDYDEAGRCADKRIELARQHSNARMEAAAWMQKAECLRKSGRREEAAQCMTRGQCSAAAPAAAG